MSSIARSDEGPKGAAMFKLEFGIVHRGCVVNELSRAMPDIRFVCPGRFHLDADSADEILAFDNPTDDAVQLVLDYLRKSRKIAEVRLLERTPERAFVRLVSSEAPEVGYCSDAVERNRCFRLGYEVQHGGVEQWKVGCRERAQAERLVEDLKGMGELKYHRISEASWEELLSMFGA